MCASNSKKPSPSSSNNHALAANISHSLRGIFSLYSGEGARKGYIAAIDQGVISISNFLATIILARIVSPKELGVYAVGFILLRLTLVIQDGIIVQPLNTFGAPMNHTRFKRYATSTAILQLGLAIALSAFAAIAGWYLITTGNDTAGPTTFYLWAPILGWQIQEFLRRSLYTRGKILKATFITTISNSIRIGLLLWWGIEGRLSGISGFHAIAIGTAVAFLPSLWQTRSYWSKQFYNPILTWDHNWRFGRWITGGNILNWISVEFYPILTAGLISFAAAGAYRALQNLVAPIHLLLRAIDTYLTPRAAKEYKEQGINALSHTLRLTYLVAGIPTALLLILAIAFPKPLLHLFYGSTYLEYSAGILIMALFYALLYLNRPLQIVLKAARYSQPIFIANAVATLAMFTFGIWAIRQWGVYGTITGQALNAAILTLVLVVGWKRFQHKKV